MSTDGYAIQPSRSGDDFRLRRSAVEYRGRRNELVVTMVITTLLFLVQQPLRHVAEGKWESSNVSAGDTALRLSLLIDAAFIIAYLLLAFRLCELARSLKPGKRTSLIVWLGLGIVTVGAGLDVIEDVELWRRNSELSLDFTALMRLSVGAGLVLELVPTVIARLRQSRRRKNAVVPTVAEKTLAPPDGTMICCSGGGIRATAFSLGGLQVLTDKQIYQGATDVIGVSGGGYAAAAYHTLRWQSGWEIDKPAYATGTPELQWLRRHTKYALDSTAAATRAGLSLAFGVAINLLLIAAAVGATTWVLSWVLLASNRVRVPTIRKEMTPSADWLVGARYDLGFAHDWNWLGWVWVIPAAGAFLFVIEKAYTRYWKPRRWIAVVSERGSVWLIWGGGALTVFVLGVPELLEALSRYALSSDSIYADLIRQLGLVPDNLCRLAVEYRGEGCGVKSAGGASGVSTSTLAGTSVVTILGSVLAVLKSLKASGTTKESTLGKVWVKIRDQVVPWLAVTVIVLILVVMLLRWVAAVTSDPTHLDDWKLAGIFGVLLAACAVFTEPNRTSMHHFFRERISRTFLVKRGRTAVEPIPYKKPLRFSESSPGDDGPRLVACAVANVSDDRFVPSGRGCTPFIFDDQRIGLVDRLLPDDTGRPPSATYEFAADHRHRDATIPAAVAMSAAAFSPLVGRENVRLGPYRAVLALANARLGVWLPNPLWVDQASVDLRASRLAVPAKSRSQHLRKWSWWGYETARNALTKPGFSRLAKEAFGKTSSYNRFLYVTDGGHYDNLGLVEALRRRAKRIYVIDASNDDEDTFRALGRAIATARMDLDCEVDLNPRGLRRLEQKYSPAGWCVGHANYADGTKAQIFMIKAIKLDGLPWDVDTYGTDNPSFPRTSTNNQLYSEFDFEAYRELGSQAMTKLLESPKYINATRPNLRQRLADAVTGWLPGSED